MKRPEIFVFALCVLISIQSAAQTETDSARLLKTVVVTQSRLSDHAIAAYELPIDSSVLALASNGSLTDLLRKQGIGHIRSYGPGGLALPSFRGTGSSHTAVLWNGINLISPLSGQLDLSLVPAGLFDDASIQTGGSTSLSGNGSIGANIHLNNNVRFNEGAKANASTHTGSFGSRYYDAGFRFSNKNFGSSTKLFLNESENDFKFTDRSSAEPRVVRRHHSAFEQHGLLQQLYHKISDHNLLSLRLWYQKSNYEVPETASSQDDAEATEENIFYRILTGWNYFRGNFDVNYQAAFIRQELDYEDPKTNIYSLNAYNNIVQNVEANLFVTDDIQLTSGLHYSWEQSMVDGYAGNTPVRNRIAIFSAVKFEPFDNWKFAFSAREEIVNGKTTPLAPGISVARQISPSVQLFSNLSRNYRLPTFNDLYWLGAGARGNPLLKPEISLSGEAGLKFTSTLLTFNAVAFSNRVDNWIAWNQPESQIWMAENIKEVWARGFECQANTSRKIGIVNLTLSGLYSFTKSTNESIYENGNLNELGKQLILTPVHEASVTLHAEWKKYRIRLIYNYTGNQFTDTDNQIINILPFYNITNLFAGREITLKDHLRFIITAEVNNLFNTEYQSRRGYPMPGINYKAGIQINFNKPNQHE